MMKQMMTTQKKTPCQLMKIVLMQKTHFDVLEEEGKSFPTSNVSSHIMDRDSVTAVGSNATKRAARSAAGGHLDQETPAEDADT